MAKEADAHSAEDKAKREEIEARNGLDNLVYNIEKMLKESGDKISASDKTDVEMALADAKKTLEGTPTAAEMNAAKDRLTEASHKMAEAMYKASSAASAATGEAPGPDGTTGPADASEKKDEGVIDAEYVDVDEKK